VPAGPRHQSSDSASPGPTRCEAGAGGKVAPVARNGEKNDAVLLTEGGAEAVSSAKLSPTAVQAASCSSNVKGRVFFGGGGAGVSWSGARRAGFPFGGAFREAAGFFSG
jgi:hypothetical protein